ncbi:precorrin-3B synthase [Nitratireductor thuwali]|uniref:Nitrite/Sulfite reductase ferredoxin-like domain-containing protein n=1 Tax=Nitratireductor thuwali TaxID=2267699 RepID=A0ABY5MP40_9HYPH|nr:hypothetical protein NTH_04243 [Nitratireductor thuwali]
MTLRRGACPSLAQPMQTGDGLLVRLAPAHGRLTPSKLAQIAQAADRFGNGLLEITTRGNLQIRGLTARTAPLLDDFMADLDLGIASGLAVETGPLAGLAVDEIADPRGLASAIAAQAAELRLAPKVSVTVDGGGPLHLGEIGADIKLEALGGGEWRIGIGGARRTARWLGAGGEAAVLSASMAILRLLAQKGCEARARHLDHRDLFDLTEELQPANDLAASSCAKPIGTFDLSDNSHAIGFALPFGQARAAHLIALCEAASNAREIRLAPGGGLLVLGLPAGEEGTLRLAARHFGFIIETTDPRLAISACAGAPFCASAHLGTKALAEEAAAAGLIDGTFRLHVSGCEKRCAQPTGDCVSLIGREGAFVVTADGTTAPAYLRTFLVERAEALRSTPSRKTA